MSQTCEYKPVYQMTREEWVKFRNECPDRKCVGGFSRCDYSQLTFNPLCVSCLEQCLRIPPLGVIK